MKLQGIGSKHKDKMKNYISIEMQTYLAERDSGISKVKSVLGISTSVCSASHVHITGILQMGQ